MITFKPFTSTRLVTFAFVYYRSKEEAKNAVDTMNGTLLSNRKIKVSLYSDRDKEFLANISAESCSEDDQEVHSDKDKENGKQEPSKDSKLKPKPEKPRRNLTNLIEIRPGKTIPNLVKAGSVDRKDSPKKTRGNNPSSLITISPLPSSLPGVGQSVCPPAADQSTAGDPSVAGVGEKFKRKKFRYFAQSVNEELGSFQPRQNKIKKAKQPNTGKFNMAGFKKFYSKRLAEKQNDQQSTSEQFSTFVSPMPLPTSTAIAANIPAASDQSFATFQFKKPNDFSSFNRQQLKNWQATKNQPKSAESGQQPKNLQQPKNHRQQKNKYYLRPARFSQFPSVYVENSSNASTSNLVNPFQPNGQDADPFPSGYWFDRQGDNPFKKDYRISKNESKKDSDSIDKNPFKFKAQPVKSFGFALHDAFATQPLPGDQSGGQSGDPSNNPSSSRSGDQSDNQPAGQSEQPTREPELVVLDNSPLPPPPRKFMDTTLFSETDLDDRLNQSIELITLD